MFGRIPRPLLAGLAILLPGCLSPSIESQDDPVGIEFSGFGSAYVVAGTEVIGPPDGKFLKIGILGSSNRDGEIASIDLWPIFGVGVGVLGARVQILPIEIGAGLFYEPSPRVKKKRRKKGAEIPSKPELEPIDPDGVEHSPET